MIGHSELILLTALALLVGALCTALWVWALVDCLRKEKPGSREKLLWVIVLFCTGILGAVTYLTVRRPARGG
jgi:hypothetical protein